MLDGGQEEQDVGGAVLSEELATHVLVDDGGDALVAALVLVIADDGDTTATAGDDDKLVVEQVENGVGLDERMESASTIFLGSGEATTRRQPRPESSTKVISGFSAMISLACSSV